MSMRLYQYQGSCTTTCHLFLHFLGTLNVLPFDIHSKSYLIHVLLGICSRAEVVQRWCDSDQVFGFYIQNFQYVTVPG
jgi:hypothetical protein